MSDLNILKKAVDTMIAVNAAVRNLRLYPATSESTRISIDKAYHSILETLEESDLVFSETEKSLFICDQPLSEKEQKKPQVGAFLEIMLNFGIKVIAFQKGLSREEFSAFLENVCEKPEDIAKKGGLLKLFEEKKVSHIQLTLVTAGEGGFRDAGKGKGSGTIIVKEALIPMINMLDELLDSENQDKISGHLAKKIAEREDEVLLLVLTHSIETGFGQKVFSHLTSEMSDEKFEQLFFDIKKQYESAVEGAKADAESLKHAYQNMTNCEKGVKLQNKIKERMAREKAEKERQQNQLKAGLNAVLKGDFQPFADKFVAESLPSTIEQFFAKDKSKHAETLLEKTAEALAGSDSGIRNGAAGVIAQIADKLLSDGRTEILMKLSHPLAEWIQTEKKLTPSSEKICLLLQKIAQPIAAAGQFAECRHILNALNQVVSGKLRQDAALRNLCAETLKSVITSEVLEPLIKEFRTNEKNSRRDAIQKLVELGYPAAERLLAILKDSPDRAERLRILPVLNDIGAAVVPLLQSQISLGEPWYYMRNIVLIFGKVGNEDHIDTIMPFLTHKDFRVQKEALMTLYNIGGDYREDILMTALPTADDRLKPDIVGMLGALDYEEAVPVFLEMLESGKIKDDLAERICTVLGNLAAVQAIPALSSLLEQKKSLLTKSFGEKVKTAAGNALKQISKGRTKPKQQRHVKKLSDRKPLVVEEEPEDHRAELQVLLEKEAQLEPLIAQNHTADALKLIVELINGYAAIKDFIKTDELRDKMTSIDAMALTEIYKADEIIEKAKAEAINKDYLTRWASLYNTLTPEETNALYFSLKKADYPAGTVLFRQGDFHDRLYFIENGEVRLSFAKDGSDVPITTLTVGETAGYDGFFLASNCTCSATAVTDISVRYIEKAILSKRKELNPALESKLSDYCLKTHQTPEVLKQNHLDRRAHKRSPLSGTLLFQTIDASGSPVGTVQRAELSDISAGGLCFSVKLPKDSVYQLLNQKLNTKFILPLGGTKHKMEPNGRVVSVGYTLANTYAVHVRFDKKIGLKS